MIIIPETNKEILKDFNYKSAEEVRSIPGSKLDFLSEQDWDRMLKNTDISTLAEHPLRIRLKKKKGDANLHFAPILYSQDRTMAIAVIEILDKSSYPTLTVFLQSIIEGASFVLKPSDGRFSVNCLVSTPLSSF